jgi:hypothetical protein
MAKPTPKERPYHCKLCSEALAEDELGFVCQHIAHGSMTTLVADAPTTEKPIPDTPCTACDVAMTQQKKNAELNADIHVVCARCYRTARARNIDYFTETDRDRGYVLVTRAHYDRVAPRDKPLGIGPIREGRELKLGFSPIPSTSPISLERMWVRVTCALKGGVFHGALANDPQLFKRKTLKENDTVVFKAGNVLEIEAKPVLREAPPKATKVKATEDAAAKAKAKDAAAKAKAKDAAAKAKAKDAAAKAKAKDAAAKAKAKAKAKDAKAKDAAAKAKAKAKDAAAKARAKDAAAKAKAKARDAAAKAKAKDAAAKAKDAATKATAKARDAAAKAKDAAAKAKARTRR